MNDKEKLDLISTVISDFYESGVSTNAETYDAIMNVIETIINFEEDING